MPGIDAAYLAMDTEEGMEVVWNEVRLSQRKTDANKARGDGGRAGLVMVGRVGMVEGRGG